MWKTCAECGVEKDIRKFFKHSSEPDGLMQNCKACHIGTTELNQQRLAESNERQWGDPTEDQIAVACLAIQNEWTIKERIKRRSWSRSALMKRIAKR